MLLLYERNIKQNKCNKVIDFYESNININL